jgi:hypothetical protein
VAQPPPCPAHHAGMCLKGGPGRAGRVAQSHITE